MTISKIDPVKNRPSIENEDVEHTTVCARFGELAQRIRGFFEFQEFSPHPLSASFRKRIDALNHRPRHQQNVAFYFAASSAAILRLNSSAVHQWLGSLSSINSAARLRRSASSRLSRPMASNRPIRSLRCSSGSASASVTICSMLMAGDYGTLPRKQGQVSAAECPGSTLVPSVGVGVPPKRTFIDVLSHWRAKSGSGVLESSSRRDASTDARDERAPRIPSA